MPTDRLSASLDADTTDAMLVPAARTDEARIGAIRTASGRGVAGVI